jgi:hypothetical protein
MLAEVVCPLSVFVKNYKKINLLRVLQRYLNNPTFPKKKKLVVGEDI